MLSARRTVIAAVLVFASLQVSPANAQPLSLQGETLVATLNLQAQAQSTCDPMGTSTIVVETDGSFAEVAAGPYPGTFHESGTIKIGPQNLPGPFPSPGPVVAADFDFTITSGSTTISGTKHFAPFFAGTNQGQCVHLENDPLSQEICEAYRQLGQWNGVGPTSVDIHRAFFQVAYQATIQDPSGPFSDSGGAVIDVTDVRGHCGSLGFASGQSFREQFLTSNGVVPLDAAAVALSPATAFNNVGGSHTVSATVTNVLLQPVANSTVLFSVQGSVSVSGSCTTGNSGQCSFTYQGPQLPGADLITACADNNGNGQANPPAEPCGEASKVWMLPASTPGQVTGGGWISPPTGTVSFGFNAQSDGQSTKGNCNVIDHRTKSYIKCVEVTALVVVGTHATFFGAATVDGVATNYRVDVDDLGESGAGQDTFKIQTDSGYVLGGLLTGGNIQIHR
jgi:hypothetical protein